LDAGCTGLARVADGPPEARMPARAAALAVTRDRGCARVAGHARGRGDPGAVEMRIGGADCLQESDQTVVPGRPHAWGLKAAQAAMDKVVRDRGWTLNASTSSWKSVGRFITTPDLCNQRENALIGNLII
jgi:hypothetical protein